MPVSPSVAAALAEGVYGIRTTSNVARGLALRFGQSSQFSGASDLLNDFAVDDSAQAYTGTSGNAVHNEQSGFAMLLKGQGARRQGEYAVVVRGTQTGADWLSNINAALDRGPGGQIVHAGFNRVWNSIKPGLLQGLRGKNPSCLHIVGHSLGGAICNIGAAQFAQDNVGRIKLYTFGSPRAGVSSFTDHVTSAIGAGNIRRVYCFSDPVPMVPIHPFYHAPKNPGGLRVPSPGNMISIGAHLMTHYGPKVANTTWTDLSAMSLDVPNHRSVDYWIGRAKSYAPMPGSYLRLTAIGYALETLLSVANLVIGATVTVGLTALDRLALMLERAVRVSEQIGTWLLEIFEQIASFAGQVVVNSAQAITAAVIRFMLRLLWNSIANFARAAVARLT